MNFISVLLIAFGLAADAFAVSMSSGAVVKGVKFRQAALIACFFAGFQMLMPIIGWGLGSSFKGLISGFDHWIAFALLVAVGGHMLKEAFSNSEERTFNPLEIRTLLMLAIATSIDALAVGITFSLLETSLFFPILMIGIITFVLSYIGVYLGRMFGHILEKKVEVVGGLILIGIGFHILLTHLADK